MSDLARLEVEQRGETCVLRILGEVDMSNADDLSASMETAIPNDAEAVVVDLSRTSYLDSAAIQLLFILAGRLQWRRRDVSLVVPPDSPIRAVLEVTGVPTLIPLRDRLDDEPAKSQGHES